MVAIVMIRSEEVVGYILLNTTNVLRKGDVRIKLANFQLRNMVRESEASMAAFKKEVYFQNWSSVWAEDQTQDLIVMVSRKGFIHSCSLSLRLKSRQHQGKRGVLGPGGGNI